MMIRLADEFGDVLVGRSTAERIRLRIQESAHGSEPVILDFEGIITVSPSFADELFAKLEPGLRQSGQLEVRGMNPALESIARFVVAGRESD
jgi:anti-anti-sigma regulatory factor